MIKVAKHFFIIGIVLLFVTSKCNAQDSVSVSMQLKYISYFWKLDSMATNGLRYFSSTYFLKCKIDSVRREDIITALGTPNRISKDPISGGETLVYFTLNPTKLPTKSEWPAARYFIAFVLDPATRRLISMYEEDDDM